MVSQIHLKLTTLHSPTQNPHASCVPYLYGGCLEKSKDKQTDVIMVCKAGCSVII